MFRFLFLVLTVFAMSSTVLSNCSSTTEPISAWEVSEDLRIGSQMGGGPDMFGEIGNISIGPNTHVYVYDNDDHEIRVFDRRGQFLHRFGGSGSGPGEFGWIWAMAWDSDNHLWIADFINGRYSVFDEAGNLIRDLISPIATRDTQLFGFDQSGHLYDQSAFVDSNNTYRRLLVQMNPNGETIGEVILPECNVQSLEMGPMRFPLPFSRRLAMCFDPSGFIWYGITDEYDIYQMALDGQSQHVIRGNIDVMPLTSSDRDSVSSYIEQLKSRYRMSSVPGDVMPHRKPIFDDIYLDRQTGHLWIKLVNYSGTRIIFDVFRTDGSIVGRVYCEIALLQDPNPVILNNEIWFVTEDEIGAQYIVRGALKPYRTPR